MNYVVFDMEWNQALRKTEMIEEPFPLYGEVIEIGAVKLDEGGNIIDKFEIMIKPKYYIKMNRKVAELTEITEKDLNKGVPFVEALKGFLDWCGEGAVLLCWGPSDAQMLYDNMLLHKLDTTGFPKIYDAQIVFNEQITKEGRQFSLSEAMEIVEEEPIYAHYALFDAEGTARVCRHLDLAAGIGSMEKSGRIPRIKIYVDGDEQMGRYGSSEEALKDRALFEYTCPYCGKRTFVGAAEELPSRSLYSKKYAGKGRCEEGHELAFELRLKKLPGGSCKASRAFFKP